MPLSGAAGLLLAVVLIKRLLLLGLPASIGFAFSAVPRLAIGIGASKLLVNLCAGSLIQMGFRPFVSVNFVKLVRI